MIGCIPKELEFCIHFKMNQSIPIYVTRFLSTEDPLPPLLSPTFVGGVSQDGFHLLVGGVLSQGAHDVGDLVVAYLVVTHPVEQTEGLPVICHVGRRDKGVRICVTKIPIQAVASNG